VAVAESKGPRGDNGAGIICKNAGNGKAIRSGIIFLQLKTVAAIDQDFETNSACGSMLIVVETGPCTDKREKQQPLLTDFVIVCNVSDRLTISKNKTAAANPILMKKADF
jgi:hypothetical protein